MTLLPLQRKSTLLFRPLADVALVMDEVPGRVTVVLANGEVAHRPGPAPSCLIELLDGIHANPAHARRRQGFLEFPGGWKFPHKGPLPKIHLPEPSPAKSVRIGRHTFDPTRLRQITWDGLHYYLHLDAGDPLTISAATGPAAARALGIPSLRTLHPADQKIEALYDEDLRDWPAPLLDLPPASLPTHLRTVIANVLWQAVRLRALGRAPDYGHDHRGFWYLPLFPILTRLGLLGDAAPMADRVLTAYEPHYAVWLQYLRILADLVGTRRLFTYRDLGFDDPRPDLRVVGAARPGIVLAVEKVSLLREAREVARQFGLSLIVLGGETTLIAVEYLAKALRPALPADAEVQVVAYVDFDPSGWIIADSFARQLARYGIRTVEPIRYLVRPARFSRKEIAAIAYPLPAATPAERTLARRWIRRGGGVGSRPLGIHADHLRPVERVIQAFQEETHLVPSP